MKAETKTILAESIGLGLFLWVIGFALGMIFFLFIPVEFLGWFILPIMFPLTAYAAYKRFSKRKEKIKYYFAVGIAWALIAIVLDNLILVQGFKAQNYYDFDIMVYYALAFLIPVIVGIKFGKK